MKNEKIFLSIFLSAAIILSSLFPFRVTFAVAEENETETASDTVADIVTEQTPAEAVTTLPESSTTTTTSETALGAIVTTPNVIITSKGDSNGDGILNARDAALIAQKAAKGLLSELPEEADFNGDGVINIRDAAAIARYLASYYTSIGT